MDPPPRASAKEEFVPTKQELDAIGKALKDKEFCKLLAEYAEEIQNPENKKRYEDELRQMEAMQGHDVKFINPEPGFVVKTKLAKASGTKVFINICECDVLERPTSKRATENGHSGLRWSLPHSIAAHREDVDKQGTHCIVYDAVFHPDALRLAKNNDGFKKMVVATAFDGIEQRFPVHQLDRKVQKFPKMKFKGMPSRSVIRSPNNAGDAQKEAASEKDKKATVPGHAKNAARVASNPETPHKEEPLLTAQTTKRLPKPQGTTNTNKTNTANASDSLPETYTPDYRVVYQRGFDMASMRDAADAHAYTRPTTAVVTISLPMCASASGVDVEVEERAVEVEIDASCMKGFTQRAKACAFTIPLSYPVDEDKARAKFDTSSRKLSITLPILPAEPSQEEQAAMARHQAPAVQDLGHTTAAVEQESHQRSSAEPIHPDTEAAEPELSTPLSDGETSDDKRSQDKEVEDVAALFDFFQSPVAVTILFKSPNLAQEDVHVEVAKTSVGTPPSAVEIHGLDLFVTKHDKAGAKLRPYLIRFDSQIDCDDVAVSVSPDNVAIVVKKVPQMQWSRVRYCREGLDAHEPRNKFRTHRFSTREKLRNDIAAMKDGWESEGGSEKLSVKESCGSEASSATKESSLAQQGATAPQKDPNGDSAESARTESTRIHKSSARGTSTVVKQRPPSISKDNDKETSAEPRIIANPSDSAKPDILSHDLLFDL